MASGRYRARPPLEIGSAGAGEVSPGLAGDVALEDPDDLPLGEALLDAAFHVAAGAGVAAHPGHDDPPERVVGLAVAAGVEPMPHDLARRRRDRRDAAEVRPGGFGADPFGVVTGGDEEDGGGVDADAVEREEAGGRVGYELGEGVVDGRELGVEI